MPTTIFFSWQIDRPPREGRNFIERALERAASQISADTTIEEAIRDQIEIDRDTKGVPGSPPIVETIFRKIDNAAVFVPDLTFVGNRPDGRPTPNPNVLIEYGWALKSLTTMRIVPIMNTAFGEPNEVSMPFDMRHLRHPVCYHCPENADEETRKRIRVELARDFESRLRAIFNSSEFKNTSTPVNTITPFKPRDPINGLSRFRLPGEPLGVSEVSLLRGGIPITLSTGPAVWLRVMPTTHSEKEWLVSEIKRAATSDEFLHPLGATVGDFGYIRAVAGFGIYAAQRDPANETSLMVFVFTNGEVWSIDTYVLNALKEHGQNAVPSMEGEFRKSLDEYTNFLRKLGIQPPFHWIAGMEDLRGRGIHDPNGRMSSYRSPMGSCLADFVIAEGKHTPGDAAGRSLAPFFTKLFDSCGVERSPSLND